MADSRTVQTYLDIDFINSIQEMANKERRSFSSMVAVLLEEAIENRKIVEKIKSKKQLQ